MKLKIIVLCERTYVNIKNEMIYSVASERQNKVDLIRFDVPRLESGAKNKAHESAVKAAKLLKRLGNIQLYATEESFALFNTEAKYLLNKYPDIEERRPDGQIDYIFVKI